MSGMGKEYGRNMGKIKVWKVQRKGRAGRE
jgi:hypothetical protein